MGLITLKEYSNMHNKAEATILSKIRNGQLKAIKKEGRYYLDEDEPYIDYRFAKYVRLDEYMQKNNITLEKINKKLIYVLEYEENEMTEGYCTVNDYAKINNVSPRSVYAKIKRGTLKTVTKNGKIYVNNCEEYTDKRYKSNKTIC